VAQVVLLPLLLGQAELPPDLVLVGCVHDGTGREGTPVLFDPDDRGAPPCLNVLQGDGTGADTDVITDNLTGIFRRIYAAFFRLSASAPAASST
jgi:hypothetical protein